MVDQLKAAGFDPLQFRLEGTRPDLSKLDTILGTLSTDSGSFDARLQTMMAEIEENGVKPTFGKYCTKTDATV